jgi:tRNA(fMet)-specific endonuclease VapC
MRLMLASDLCRLLLTEQPRDLLEKLQTWTSEGQEIVISAITYAELIAASLQMLDQSRHMSLVEAFCARLDEVVPWDTGAVRTYTNLQYALMQSKQSLNMNDVMIAAHAISLDARLLSQNSRAFEAIVGLNFQLFE